MPRITMLNERLQGMVAMMLDFEIVAPEGKLASSEAVIVYLPEETWTNRVRKFQTIFALAEKELARLQEPARLAAAKPLIQRGSWDKGYVEMYERAVEWHKIVRDALHSEIEAVFPSTNGKEIAGLRSGWRVAVFKKEFQCGDARVPKLSDFRAYAALEQLEFPEGPGFGDVG